MARFKADIEGNRGPASRLGSAVSGIGGHIRGWQSGVKVDGWADTDSPRDSFDVCVTGGSNFQHPSRLIATVRDLPDGKRETVLYHPRTGKVVARHVE